MILARERGRPCDALQKVLAPFGSVTTILDRAGPPELAEEPQSDSEHAVIHVGDEKAERFSGMMSTSGSFPQITAWSRAFAHLSDLSLGEEAIWFVEDDVAGDQDSFSRMITATLSHQPDLAAIDIRSRSDNPEWSWWNYADGYFLAPAAAFQPLCRLSTKLVQAVLNFQKTHGTFIFHEVLFASLAKLGKMKTLSWDRSAEFQYLLRSFRYRPEVTTCAHGISHPVKDPDVHASICRLPAAELPRKPSAPVNAWTVLPEDYDFLARFCRNNGIRRVGEFGPGNSTLAFLDAGCRVTSFEHDAAWMNRAREQFDGEASVELLQCEAGAQPSLSDFEGALDLVFVDGPPAWAGVDSPRLQPCTWGLAACGLIILHDTERPGERAILDLLKEQGMSIIRIPTGRGLAVVIDPRRRPDCLGWNFSGA